MDIECINDIDIDNPIDNTFLLKELLNKQIKSIPLNKKLTYGDFKRIIKYIDISIFHEDKCCLWNGYVTNSKPDKNYKGAYVNFYFKKKKVALHRLLFINFKQFIEDTDYIKYTCNNKGSCCNINHMVKFSYNKKKIYNNNLIHGSQNKIETDKTGKLFIKEINSDNDEDFMIGFN